MLAAFRKRGLPIIHVVRLYLADGSNADLCRRESIRNGSGLVTPGSDGAELVAGLTPDPSLRLDADLLLNGGFQEMWKNEWAMYKPRWDAFYSTPLEEHLRKLGVTTVAVIGCNFPNCPRATIYGASMRDFQVAIFPGGHIRHLREGHRGTREYRGFRHEVRRCLSATPTRPADRFSSRAMKRASPARRISNRNISYLG